MIKAYTDGACSPNPGHAGCGVVLLYGQHIKKISEYIGTGTNNIAELKAVDIALKAIKNRAMPILVFSDSQYAINVLSGKWNASKNRELISEIKNTISTFDSIAFKWIRGHNGDKYNEIADTLANKAIREKGGKP